MSHRFKYRLTILGAMGYVAVVGCILALFAANRHQLEELITIILLPSLVILVPVHFAIEANRRDAIKADLDESSRDERGRSPGPT